MKSLLLILPLTLMAVSCATVGYRLSPADVGKTLTLKGTVLAVEADGDLLLESDGRIAFIDVEVDGVDVEMGQQVIVTGEVEQDADEGEAPELDAQSIKPWIR